MIKPKIDSLQLMTGVDIPVEGLGITLRQPSITDISMLGEINYFIALRLFTSTKEQMKIDSDQHSNWDIFQKALTAKIEGVSDTRALMFNFLQLFFKSTPNLGPRSIIVMQDQEIINIEPEDFDGLQFLIGKIGGKELLSGGEEEFKPKNRLAEKIAQKMKKAREKLAKVKAIENGTALQNNDGFLSGYIKAVSTVTANSLEQVKRMTLLQLVSIMKTYLNWEAYDLETKSRLAGAKGDKEIIHWTMRSTNSEENSIGVI